MLITGVTGFIGSSLASRLVEMGYKVYGLVRHTSSGRNVPSGVMKVFGDLTDYHSLVSVVRSVRPEVVFHVGALTPVSLSYDQPRVYAEVNYLGTVNLLEALRRHSHESLVLVAVAGTTEMYNTPYKIRNGIPFRPESPYAISKVASVLYAEYVYRAYNMPTVVVIPTNTYGRAFVRQHHFFIEKLIVNMLLGKRRIELGSPDCVRDWMFREDHVDAYIRILQTIMSNKDGVIGNRFYFGTGVGYTTRDTAKVVSEVVGWRGELVWNAFQRPSETMKIVVDYTKSSEVLGWEPKWNLRDGVRKAVEEWREVLGL